MSVERKKNVFDEFVRTNGIVQKQLALMLGVSETFVSRLRMGNAKVPKGKVEMLRGLAKSEGWDVSMFDRPKQEVKEGIILNAGGVSGGQVAGRDINNKQQLTEYIKGVMEKKDGIIERLIEKLISMMETVQNIQAQQEETYKKLVELLEKLTEVTTK